MLSCHKFVTSTRGEKQFAHNLRIHIQTANLGLSPAASSKTVSPDNCDNDRQSEMAIWLQKPVNIYLSDSVCENLTDSVEIPTANMGFLTTRARTKCAHRLRQQLNAGNG